MPFRPKAGDALSAREIQVLRLLRGEGGHKAVARQLGISPHTVHHYVKNMYVKTQTHDCAGLLAWWRAQPK